LWLRCWVGHRWRWRKTVSRRAAKRRWPAALMAVVGLAAGDMVVLPYTATGSCTPTIRITAATGIGITKQIAGRRWLSDHQSVVGGQLACLEDHLQNARTGSSKAQYRCSANDYPLPSFGAFSLPCCSWAIFGLCVISDASPVAGRPSS